jgi:hypothetical protein
MKGEQNLNIFRRNYETLRSATKLEIPAESRNRGSTKAAEIYSSPGVVSWGTGVGLSEKPAVVESLKGFLPFKLIKKVFLRLKCAAVMILLLLLPLRANYMHGFN